MRVWKLINEDITMAAGGPMGSHAEIRWEKLFSSLHGAKLFAQKAHPDVKLIWSKQSNGLYSSQDLGSTIYSINPEKVQS